MNARFKPRCPSCGKDLAHNYWLKEVYDCINMDCPLYYKKYADRDKHVRIIMEKIA